MIIPIGLDQTVVRRLPWITFGIIALNIVVFVMTGMGGTDAEKEAYLANGRMVEYWRTHPYLEPPRSLVEAQPSERARDEFKAFTEILRQASRSRPVDSELLAAEQTELDRLGKAFLAAVNSHPFHRWGLKPARIELLAFFTCLFIHAGWLHLFGNMLLFYLAGPFVEDAFGRPVFAALYVLGGIAASFAHILANPGSMNPLGGASGAIAAIMGAFLIRFARTKIRFFYWLGLFFTGTFEAPAMLMLPLWLFQQVFMAMMGAEGGIAYAAHIGGFVFGAAVAGVIKLTRIEEKHIAPAIEREISVTQHPALDEGMTALSRGETARARELIGMALAENPRNFDAHLAMWHCCVAGGRPVEGADNLVRVIDDEVRRGELLLAAGHWHELVTGAHVGGPAALRARLAAAIEPTDADAAKAILRNLADDPGAGLLAEKAVRKLAALGESYTPPAPKPAPPPPPPPPPPEEFSELNESEPPPRFYLEIVTPINFQESGMVIQGAQGGTELLAFSSVVSLAIAGIQAQPRPYLLVDLVLRGYPGEPPRVVRLISSSFDPRRLLDRTDLHPMAAFRELITAISSAAAAPVAPEGVLGDQLRVTTFASEQAYEDAVLSLLL